MIDQRGIPTHECINCGGDWFNIIARFEDYEIAMYMVEATCVNCGSELDAPTLVDSPFYQKG